MSDVTARPSYLRRVLGTTALYVVGVPMIVIGMLLVFPIVAYDSVGLWFRKLSARSTPDATLENHTSVGINVGADLYLLNNLPSVVNDVIGSPFHLTGSTGVTNIPIADNGPFLVGFSSHTYDFLV